MLEIDSVRLGVQFEQLDGVIKGKEGSFDLKVRFEQYVYATGFYLNYSIEIQGESAKDTIVCA